MVNRTWGLVLLFLAALPCLALVYVRNPEEPGFFPPCIFNSLTGLFCPGCGSLRGLHQLMHGNFLAALGYNSYTILALPLLGLAVFYAFLLSTNDSRILAAWLRPFFLWGLLVAVLAFWVLRNIPVHPFTVLAP